MMNEPLTDPVLQRILWACLDYWNAETVSERSICYKWVARRYKDAFGGTFHQSALHNLSRIGFLIEDETSRAGHRRYYRIADPAQLAESLKGWNLN